MTGRPAGSVCILVHEVCAFMWPSHSAHGRRIDVSAKLLLELVILKKGAFS